MNGALKGAPARLVFDFTTTALWSGPPTGIVRVESKFARWARAHVAQLALGFFDPKTHAFRSLDRDIADILISQQAAIDPFSFVNPARLDLHWRAPPALRPTTPGDTDLCGITRGADARPGAFDDFTPCLRGDTRP